MQAPLLKIIVSGCVFGRLRVCASLIKSIALWKDTDINIVGKGAG